jgi:hypothetical protein
MKPVKSWMHLDAHDWQLSGTPGDEWDGRVPIGPPGTFFSARDYETVAEKQLSIAIAAELRPAETLPSVRPIVRKKDAKPQGFNVLIPSPSQHGDEYLASMVRIQRGFEGLDEAHQELVRQFQRRSSHLFLNGMTSKERWKNVDAFQTWRHHGVWKSDIYPHEVSASSKIIHGRPTGTIVLVPPTPTTIPYGVISTVGKKKADVPKLEPQPVYNFGILDNVTGGQALDEALARRKAVTSLDRNFDTGKGGGIWSSEPKNWDGEDFVSEVATPVSLGYEHSPTGKERDFKTLPSVTMFGPAENIFREIEYFRSELELGVPSDLFERVVLFEFYRAYQNASKADGDMNAKTLAASIRETWKKKTWQYPPPHPVSVWFPRHRSDFVRRQSTQYLRHITEDQVRGLREKSQKLLDATTRRQAGRTGDAVWATLPDAFHQHGIPVVPAKERKPVLSTT